MPRVASGSSTVQRCVDTTPGMSMSTRHKLGTLRLVRSSVFWWIPTRTGTLRPVTSVAETAQGPVRREVETVMMPTAITRRSEPGGEEGRARRSPTKEMERQVTARVEPHPRMKRKRQSRRKRSRRKTGRRRKRLRQLRQKRLREMKRKRQHQQKQKLRRQIQKPQKLPSTTVPVLMPLLPNQQLKLTRKRQLNQRQLQR
mmetsp:Transcript_13417/g.22068  ORF Transcript_13417/g.22068 Transcript_13417/m.22068 type:complete len:200 (+) Transcript_13417:147-746(+)